MTHLCLLAGFLLGQSQPTQPTGHLILAGGGPTLGEITQRALALAGGKKARVLIIPQASSRADAGERSEGFWRKAGAQNISVLNFKDKKAALAAIRQADLIWMPGGSQSRLMETLLKEGLVDPIRQRYRQGATVGGTSAGAAVMSLIMLTGESRLDTLTADAIKTAEGLGLWPEVIIDQHYLRRSRFNRLLNAVLSHPKTIGIGIDESTAVVVTGRWFEVVGRSNVIVIDARKATKVQTKNGEPASGANVSLQVLKAGMKFDLDKGLLSQ